MWQLNLPNFNFNVKEIKGKEYIFDNQRKRFVALTPEEWVRQHFVHFLIEHKHYPASLLAIEYQLNINGMKKRCDAVLFDNNASPKLICEFKAPDIPLSQEVFDQVAVYNSRLNVNFFIVSNGKEHYCCQLDNENSRYLFFNEIPDYKDIKSRY